MGGWLALVLSGLALVQFLGGPATQSERPPVRELAAVDKTQTPDGPVKAPDEPRLDGGLHAGGATVPISATVPVSAIDPISTIDVIGAIYPISTIDPVSRFDPIVAVDPLISVDPGGRIGSADEADSAGEPGPMALAAPSKTETVRDMIARSLATRHEIECLALNIYFEARSEPDTGKRAVGHVVMNRVSDHRFPGTACEVVRQGGEAPRHRCQFSWWCDGKSDQPRDWAAWSRSKAIAREIYWGRSVDPTNGALWYHADYVAPCWGAILQRVTKIGRHIFYQDPDRRKVQVATAYEATEAQ